MRTLVSPLPVEDADHQLKRQKISQPPLFPQGNPNQIKISDSLRELIGDEIASISESGMATVPIDKLEALSAKVSLYFQMLCSIFLIS